MLYERHVYQRVCCFSALVATAISLDSSSAGELYGGGASSKSFYSIDLESGMRTPLKVTGHVNDVDSATGLFKLATVNGLAYHSGDGYLYATTRVNGPPPRGLPAGNYPDELSIFRIHPSTFALQRFQISGLPPAILQGELRTLSGLEYDSRRDVFWATDTGGGFGQLICIDAQTFQATVAGYLSSPTASSRRFVSGLAYDHVTDTLYGVDDGLPANLGTKLIAVAGANLPDFNLTSSPNNIIPTMDIGVAGLGLELSDVDSLTFDPVRRRLYAIEDLPLSAGIQGIGQLVSIDPTTGQASAIGYATGRAEFYQGLAFIPPAPLEVDGNDFLAWQRGVGIAANATFDQGDFSGDGKVDRYDLDLWKYSMSFRDAHSEASLVPECHAFAPMVIAWLAMLRIRHPGRGHARASKP